MSELVKQTLEGSALSGLLHVPSDPICDGGEEIDRNKSFSSLSEEHVQTVSKLITTLLTFNSKGTCHMFGTS
jgi:hypothetical protein